VGCLLLQRCLLLELCLPALSAQALATASDGFVHDRPRNHNVNQGRGGSQKMALCLVLATAAAESCRPADIAGTGNAGCGSDFPRFHL
jgi:hypothetical protein